MATSIGAELRSVVGELGDDPVVASLVLDAEVASVEAMHSDLDGSQNIAGMACQIKLITATPNQLVDL
jgi:hypothetical protein